MIKIINIAWRNIWRNPARSLVIILSVVIGLWAGAFVTAIYYGMARERMRIAIEREVSHIQIHHPAFRPEYEPDKVIGDANQLTQTIDRVEGVKAVSMRDVAQGMISTAGASSGIQIFGIDPAQEAAVTGLSKKLVAGSYFGNDKKNSLLIGKVLADKMNVKLNSKVVLTFLDRSKNITSAAFRIVGLYQSQNEPLDKRFIFVQRADLGALLGVGNDCHEAAILLNSDDLADTIRQQLQQQLPALQVETWKTISPETELVVTSIDQKSIIIVIIILLALAFGIVNTMLMSVLERTREIGVLMALGMNKMKLFFMILLETFFLTFIGCPFGLLLAWGFVKWISRTGIDLSYYAGKVMSNFGYGAIIYPILQVSSLIQILEIVFFTALVSAIFPAIKALRLNPVEAIRS